MYKYNDLLSLTKPPKINSISLKVLSEFYENYLCQTQFRYILMNKNEEVIELRFKNENFCHLVGIEKIVKSNVNKNSIVEYKGEKGWDNIKNGIITFEILKSINKSKFKSGKEKFIFFYLIPKLMESPQIILYDRTKVNPKTEIECKMIFYNTHDNVILHIGIEIDSKNNYYIPRTFFVEKITDHTKESKYLKNQTELTLIKVIKDDNRII